MIRAAAYLRVSTDKQDHANQRPDVLRLAEVRDYDVTDRIFEETESAAKKRPVFEAMMTEARRHRFDVLLFWSLDRFGRTMWETAAAIKELDRIGVQVISARDTWLDTTSPVRDLLIAIFSWIAEQERRRISERTIAGIARARAAGKQIGGVRTIPPEAGPRAVELRAAGMSWSRIAGELGISPASARRLFMGVRHNVAAEKL